MRVLVLVPIMRYETLDKFLTCSLVVVVGNWLVPIFLQLWRVQVSGGPTSGLVALSWYSCVITKLSPPF
jgi:hypothetical protein